MSAVNILDVRQFALSLHWLPIPHVVQVGEIDGDAADTSLDDILQGLLGVVRLTLERILDLPEAAIKLVVRVTDDLVEKRHAPQRRALHVQQQPNDEIRADGVLGLLGCVIRVDEPFLRYRAFLHRPVVEIHEQCGGLHVGAVLEILVHGTDQHLR